MDTRRRAFAAMACGVLAWPAARAQPQGPRKTARIGVFWLGEVEPEKVVGLRQDLAAQGLVEGTNLVIEPRWAAGPSQFDAVAAELVALQPDLIVVTAGTVAILAVKRATATIPIVFTLSSEPAQRGVVESLARPGGNATGNAIMGNALNLKRYQVLREVIGDTPTVAVLDSTLSEGVRNGYLGAGPVVPGARPGRIVFMPLAEAAEIEPAFERMAREGVQAVSINPFPVAAVNEARIAALVARYRLPAIADGRAFAKAGVLLSYTTYVPELQRRLVNLVVRILQGARPADLPVELVSRFELIVNMRTARALSLRIPPAILARADHVIE